MTTIPTETKKTHLLALHAAEGTLQIVLARQEVATGVWQRLCAQEWYAPSQGVELLVPALQNMCQQQGIAAHEIEKIACVRGPGGFTGLRLVLATAAGLARATGAQRAGLDYLPLLAQDAANTLSLPCATDSSAQNHASATAQGVAKKYYTGQNVKTLWVCTHARRNLVHLQGFLCSETLEPVNAIVVCSPQDAANLISTHAGHNALLGSGLLRNTAEFVTAFEQTVAPVGTVAFLGQQYASLSADTLLHAATQAAYSAEDLAPLYVRPCDAEENLPNIARTLHLDPEEAQKAFHRLTTETFASE